jgi:hypothetical protein
MARRSLRALILVGALTALSIPVFSASGTASACSNPDCSVFISGGSSGIDTFISPLSASFGSISFPETPTQAQLGPTATTTLVGSVELTVTDLRGNNQGFSVYLDCGDAFTPCVSSPQAPDGIPGSAATVLGLPTDENVELIFGDATGDEGGEYIPDPTGMTLNNEVLVGGECQVFRVGTSFYDETVPVGITFPNELLTLPVSWSTDFSLFVVENQPPAGCSALGEFVDAVGGGLDDF